MALNIKVALVVCVVFIGGMCWVVNLVARPVLELPAPAVVLDSPRGEGLFSFAVPNPDRKLAFGSPAGARSERPRVSRRLPEIGTPPPVRGQVLPPVLASLDSDPATAAAVAAPASPIVHEPPVARAIPRARIAADATLIEEAAAVAVVDEPLMPREHEATPIETLLHERARAGGPDGPPAVLASDEAVPDSERPSRGGAEKYTVRSGDTLGRILARRWGRSDPEAIAAILACNAHLRDENHIVEGDELLIPSFAAARQYRAEQLEAASQQVAAASSAKRGAQRMYTVREDDTLSKIAERELNDSRLWTEIARLNNVENADRIRPGTQLKLPAARTDT